MRRILPHAIALLLGAAAALLVACGGAGGTKGGIPAASAGELKDQLETVRRAVADKRCDGVVDQLNQVDDDINTLPGTVDARLRRSLRDASDLLHQTAQDECKSDTTETQTQTQTVQTQTETQTTQTQTQTVPAQTQTTPPVTTTTPTTTQPPPPTTTTPPPTKPPPPPAEPPTPVPAPPPSPPSTGGGATPEIP